MDIRWRSQSIGCSWSHCELGAYIGASWVLMEPKELAARVASPAAVFSLPLPRATITVLAACGSDAVLAASRDAMLLVIELFSAMEPPKVRCQYQLQRAAFALAADSDSSGTALIFVGTGSHEIERFVLRGTSIAPPSDGTPPMLVGHGRGAVTALAANNGLLCSAGNDMTLRLWDGRAGVALALLASGVEPPVSLSLLSEYSLLLSASNAGAGAISVWRLPSLFAAASSSGGVRELCIAPVVSAMLGGVARATSLLNGGANAALRGDSRHGGGGGGGTDAMPSLGGGSMECLHTFALGTNRVHAVCLAPGGLAALSASHTGELQCWGWTALLEAPCEVQQWTYKHLGHTEPIRALTLVGDTVVTASSDRTLRVARCAGNGGGERGRQRRSSIFGGIGGLGGLAPAGSPSPSPEAARRGSVGAGAFATGSAKTDADAERRQSVEDMLRGVEDAADALSGL